MAVRVADHTRLNHVRRRYGIAICAVILVVTGAHASAQAPTHGAPEGAAYHVSGVADLAKNDRVRISLACPDGSIPCRGAVRLTTRDKVRVRRAGGRRIVTVVSGSYGEIAPGTRKRVSLPLRRSARYHVHTHKRTATRISIENEASSEPLFLSSHVDVRNRRVR